MSQVRLATLPEIEVAVWQELTRAVHDKHHEWRTLVLSTVANVDGELTADARNVVLREVNASVKQLVMYTDARASKAQQLREHPIGTVVMWSRRLGWQLRCRVKLSLEDSGLAVTSRWETLKLSPAAQDYLSPLAPGVPLTGASAAALSARHHFAVITAEVVSIDWLELHREGHRRAVFSEQPAAWVQA
jgi:pyridoxamine 5'-phosphate oxidase